VVLQYVAWEVWDSSNTVSFILFHSVSSSALSIRNYSLKKSLNNPTFSTSQQWLCYQSVISRTLGGIRINCQGWFYYYWRPFSCSWLEPDVRKLCHFQFSFFGFSLLLKSWRCGLFNCSKLEPDLRKLCRFRFCSFDFSLLLKSWKCGLFNCSKLEPDARKHLPLLVLFFWLQPVTEVLKVWAV
jgi:hypothetical protein